MVPLLPPEPLLLRPPGPLRPPLPLAPPCPLRLERMRSASMPLLAALARLARNLGLPRNLGVPRNLGLLRLGSSGSTGASCSRPAPTGHARRQGLHARRCTRPGEQWAAHRSHAPSASSWQRCCGLLHVRQGCCHAREELVAVPAHRNGQLRVALVDNRYCNSNLEQCSGSLAASQIPRSNRRWGAPVGLLANDNRRLHWPFVRVRAISPACAAGRRRLGCCCLRLRRSDHI